MIPILLWTAGAVVFIVEIAVVGFRAWSDGDAIRADEVRLTLPLADEREDLTGDWPQRQTPTDLAAAYEPVQPPWPWTLPLVPGLSQRFAEYGVMGVNRVRSEVEILRDLDAAQFQLIVEASYGPEGWKCPSCAVGLDGEHQHQSCRGCSCHCGDSQGAEIVHIGEAGRNAWMDEVAA